MDNRGWWYFTFGNCQEHAGHYVKIWGTFNEARTEMFNRYGPAWAFQYSEKEWHAWVDDCKRSGAEWMLETELK